MKDLKEQRQDSVPTVSTLVNAFFHYLYNLSCNLNPLIEDLDEDGMEDIFLLKYSIFALIFLNKLTSHHDREFASNFIKGYNGNQDKQCFNFKKEDLNFIQKLIKLGDIYPKALESFYIAEMKHKYGPLKKQRETFFLLPLDDSFNYHIKSNLDVLSERMRFISGCNTLKITVTDTLYPESWTESAVTPKPLLKVDAAGLQICIILLRNLLGHPKMITNIFPHFKISENPELPPMEKL